ncbi:hypothetical protein [Caballeronia sp. KNU42]
MDQQKPATVIGIISLIVWIWFSFDHRDMGSPPKIPGSPTLDALVTLVGLVSKITPINEAEAAVAPNPMAPQGATLNLREFVYKNNIRSPQDVSDFDANAQKNLVQCTYGVLQRGEVNPIAMRLQRVDCLHDHGYTSNDVAYMGAKFATR